MSGGAEETHSLLSSDCGNNVTRSFDLLAVSISLLSPSPCCGGQHLALGVKTNPSFHMSVLLVYFITTRKTKIMASMGIAFLHFLIFYTFLHS